MPLLHVGKAHYFELCRNIVSCGKPLFTLPNEANAPLISFGARPLDVSSPIFPLTAM